MNDLSFTGELNQPHAHGGVEIICFKEDGRLEAGGERFECHAGDVAVIPPSLSFGVDCESGVLAVLDKAFLPVKRTTVFPASQAAELFETVELACRHAGCDGRKVAVASAYGGLIAALVTAYTAPNGFSPAVKAVMDDVDKHVGDPTYSLESFIRSLPLNYDYVRKLFKKEAGLTPHEYLTKTRMERAHAILQSGVTNRYSDYTVTQIAEACGFSEPLYFSRVFKKHFGVAPSHYLKNN